MDKLVTKPKTVSRMELLAFFIFSSFLLPYEGKHLVGR